MINPLYQQMVVRVTRQNLLPMTTDRKLSANDLQQVANQGSTVPDQVRSTVMFLLNSFESLAKLGDNDPDSISEQDILRFETEGVNVSVEA